MSHHLYRRMFSQAQACANIILQVSSYQYQAGQCGTLQCFSQDVFLTAENCLISCIEECSPKHRHVLTLFHKLAHTITRQDITSFHSRCFLNSRALSHQLCAIMLSQAQACAKTILQVSSYQYQAGHYNISSRRFLNSRALSHQLYRRMFSQAQACANTILQVSSYQYQAGHYNISVKMFS